MHEIRGGIWHHTGIGGRPFRLLDRERRSRTRAAARQAVDNRATGDGCHSSQSAKGALDRLANHPGNACQTGFGV